MEATVFLGTFNAAEMCLDTNLSPLTTWLGFCSYMHCQLWDLI
jgi:hypothetical protein